MKLKMLVYTLAILLVATSQVSAVTMTFDDIPEGMGPEYYSSVYGIGWDRGFYAADHTGSTWGAPHSGSNVLAWEGSGGNAAGMMLKNDVGSLYASCISGYFSTEQGVVLEAVGYHDFISEQGQVASAFIGGPGQAWQNVHVQLASASGINIVVYWPVNPETTEALQHFCADDITVTFVPEPSSLLALGAGGFGVLWAALRRRSRARV